MNPIFVVFAPTDRSKAINHESVILSEKACSGKTRSFDSKKELSVMEEQTFSEDMLYCAMPEPKMRVMQMNLPVELSSRSL
jgi:hypothetical protein